MHHLFKLSQGRITKIFTVCQRSVVLKVLGKLHVAELKEMEQNKWHHGVWLGPGSDFLGVASADSSATQGATGTRHRDALRLATQRGG